MDTTTEFLDQTAIFNSSLMRSVGPSVGGTIDQLDNISLSEVSGFKELAAPWYSDQILPFDITLAGTNEVGAATCMKIFGVEILNEGSGVSIDDAVTEMQATFVARYVEPWPFQVRFHQGGSSARTPPACARRGLETGIPNLIYGEAGGANCGRYFSARKRPNRRWRADSWHL